MRACGVHAGQSRFATTWRDLRDGGGGFGVVKQAGREIGREKERERERAGGDGGEKEAGGGEEAMRGCCREGREGDFDEALLRDERYGTRRQRETKQRETLTRQSLPASSEAERETLTRLSA